MRWVPKRSIAFVVAVLIPAVIGVGFLASNNEKAIVEIPTTQTTLKIQCFDLESLLIFTTTDDACSTGFTFLGDAALAESRTATGEVIDIHPLLGARFEAAQSFARADGVVLTLTSGYRSLERQQMLFKREVVIRGSESEAAKWVLPAQYSHHPRGLAIDVNYPNGRAEALWLERNGSRFGLCRVYANEWWHFEGVIAPGGICPTMATNALVDLK